MLAGTATSWANIDAELAAAGWQTLQFEDKVANEFSLTPEGEIAIAGDGSVSVLWRPVELAGDEPPTLSWSWLVDEGPGPTDLARKGGDDRAISLYVSFKFDPDRASFWERSKRALVQPFVEDELPGRVLLYVWGGTEASDAWIDNPYFDGIGKMKIFHAADEASGKWFHHEIDLQADHLAAFDEQPTSPYQLAISSDGDDTLSKVSAKVADILIGGRSLR